MTYKVYDVAGTFTDNTNGQEYVYTNGVTLTSGALGADIFTDGTGSITAAANGIYVFVGSQGGGSIVLNASDRAYAGDSLDLNVTANGADDQIFGSSNGHTDTLLNGTNQSFFGSSGLSTITVAGTNDKVFAKSGLDFVIVNMATALSATVDAGGGTLYLSDDVADSGLLTMDMAKNTVSNAEGLTIANVGNLDYTISNPNTSARRTASTKFTLESGSNTLDFSFSSGSNTVYNTGGSTKVDGGSGTDVVVGGTGSTELASQGGTDTLYGGSGMSVLQPASGDGTDRFYGGSGTDYLFGGAGSGNDYMYGAGGTDYFQGGGGNNVLVEGTHSDEFHGTVGNDYVYGSSAGSKVYGGSGADFVYTGSQAQYFYSGSGKEYFEEMQGTQSNGKLDVVDNFQTAANGKGTFVFLPSSEASSTSFVHGQGGVYIQTEIGGGQSSSILVANTNNIAAVKAQTYFNI